MKRLFPPLQYLNIPNTVTSLAIIIGLICLVLIANGFTRLPVILFVLLFILDFSDGVIARRFKQITPIGKEMDSLADAINFCVLPAVFSWALGMRSIIEIVILCAYVLSGIWRLAFYNVHGLSGEDNEDPTFAGLPSTYAAAYFLVTVCLILVLELDIHLITSIYLSVASVLMISSLPVRKKGFILPVTTISVFVSVILFLIL
jgi:CDP-diacylglycerol--serine O-phosphatidyltransferase